MGERKRGTLEVVSSILTGSILKGNHMIEKEPFDGKYIRIKDCKDGYLYIIHARNAIVGIYNESDKAFTINRLKFNNRFLFDEYHWDTGAPYGTAVPLKEVEKSPEFKNYEEKLSYLYKKEIDLESEKIKLDPGYARWKNI